LTEHYSIRTVYRLDYYALTVSLTLGSHYVKSCRISKPALAYIHALIIVIVLLTESRVTESGQDRQFRQPNPTDTDM